MYYDIHRHRWLIPLVIVLPVLVILSLFIFRGPTTPSVTVGTTATTLSGAPTSSLPHGVTSSLPLLPVGSTNLASRKAAVLAGEVGQRERTAVAFNAEFLRLANSGPVPHYTIVSSLGATRDYPLLVRFAVVGSSERVCIVLPASQVVPLPAEIVRCP